MYRMQIVPPPGSSLHAIRAIEHPRWEDYTYEPFDTVQNRFYWLGDGQTYPEKTLTGDREHAQLPHIYLDAPNFIVPQVLGT